MAHPTLEDVAARAGVSRALVSLVMRGSPKVGKERREAVLKAADELGYRPNVMARGLAAGRTGMVGVLADMHDPAFAAVQDGIAAEAARRGVRLLLAAGGGRPARERAALGELLDLRLDGLLLAGPRIAAADIERAAAGCPIAVVGRSLRSARVDCVTADDAAAMALAVQHLAGLGHRHIAYVNVGGSGRSRLGKAYEAAISAAGLAPAQDLLNGGPAGEGLAGRASEPPAFGDVSGRLSGGSEVEESATRASGRSGGGPVRSGGGATGVVAVGDVTGTAALVALLRAGLDVPGDVSLVVVGEAPGAAVNGVTTVSAPPAVLGGLAMGALLDRIDDGGTREGRRIAVPPVLTERTTTNAVR